MNETRERFTALIEAHSRAMFRAARAVLDCDADAEDAVGEAVLLAWQAFGGLRDEGKAKSWLLKIAVNCAYTQRRRLGRVVCVDDMERVAGAAEMAEPTGLWDAVGRLPADQRLAVTLYYYDDLPVAEIARTLGVPQGTVKSRLSRGRARLAQLLREEDFHDLQTERI